MTEVFLVNYSHKKYKEWVCNHMTHSLAQASVKAKALRDKGFIVNVQSVLINEDGKVEL